MAQIHSPYFISALFVLRTGCWSVDHTFQDFRRHCQKVWLWKKIYRLKEDAFAGTGPKIKSCAASVCSARNYRPCLCENQPKLSFSIKWKRAFWACFRENWVYKFGHRFHPVPPPTCRLFVYIRAGIFKKSMGARHRGGIGFSYRPARLHRLAEFIPWHQFRSPRNI